MVFEMLRCFFFVLVIILQILILKHTLQLNYHFQVHASQCCSHVAHLQFKLKALLKYEVYYLHPKHSFHVIQQAFLLSPISLCMASHVLRTQEWTYQANTSYIQHLTTWGREISNSH